MWPTYCDWKRVCRWKEAVFEQNAMVLLKTLPTQEKINLADKIGNKLHSVLGYIVSHLAQQDTSFELNQSNWNNESMRDREKKPKKCYHFHERA